MMQRIFATGKVNKKLMIYTGDDANISERSIRLLTGFYTANKNLLMKDVVHGLEIDMKENYGQKAKHTIEAIKRLVAKGQ